MSVRSWFRKKLSGYRSPSAASSIDSPGTKKGAFPEPLNIDTTCQYTSDLSTTSPTSGAGLTMPTPQNQSPALSVSPGAHFGALDLSQNAQSPLGLHLSQTPFKPLSAVPLHLQSPPTPRRLDTALSIMRELLTAMRDASDLFLPLKASLVGLLKVWDVCERTVEIQQVFIELASKLSALSTIAIQYKQVADMHLQQRLNAIATALDQLAQAIAAKRDRSLLARATQSLGDVAVIDIMFRRLSSLLEVFQFESQVRTETLLVTILQRLDTAQQQQMTSIDAVNVILAHINEQHVPTREAYQAILDHLERGEPAGANEAMVNNNANENEFEGIADLVNNNANDNELWVEGRGGSILNNNGNINRVFGGANAGVGGDVDKSSRSNWSPTDGGSPWPRGSIVNNNGNKNVVRRFTGSQPASPIQSTGSSRF